MRGEFTFDCDVFLPVALWLCSLEQFKSFTGVWCSTQPTDSGQSFVFIPVVQS